jgi:hypothetical protein
MLAPGEKQAIAEDLLVTIADIPKVPAKAPRKSRKKTADVPPAPL